MPACARMPLAACLFLSVAACGGGLSSSTPGGGNLDATGLGLDPESGRRFVVEPGAADGASAPSVTAALWGRQVDVYALDPTHGERTPVMDGLVVGPELSSDGRDFELGRSLATGHETLTILHPAGSTAFAAGLELAQAGLVPLSQLEATPADATLVLALDDLLPLEGVAAGAVELVPVSLGGVLGAHATLDPSHGALVAGRFHSSRVLVRASDPRGFLAGTGLASAEVSLRLPTRGGVARVQDRDGRTVAALAGGALDASSSTRDLARAFRIDSAPLVDAIAPAVLGRQRGQITQVRPTNDPTGFVIDFQFTTPVCAVALQVGDSLRSPGHVVEVLAPTSPPDANGLVVQVRARLVGGNPATYAPAGAELRAPWNPALGAPPACYVRFVPVAQLPPAAGVSNQSSVQVTFTEPMEPLSVQSTGTLRVAYGTGFPPSTESHVVGSISAAPGLTEFGFVPSAPLRHAAGQADTYAIQLRGDAFGVTDLAGNPLADDLPDVSFTLDPVEPVVNSGGVTLTFQSGDEDMDGAPEVRGSLLYDLFFAELRGRPVGRFSTVLDQQQPLIGAMPFNPSGLQTPLSPFGSKSVNVWRYIDMGFGLLDSQTHDLDVEGLAWAPFAGQVVPDAYSEFRMALAHCFFLPDEAVSAGLLPVHRFSGLVDTFDDNLLSATEDPLTVVHPKASGYVVDPADAFQSPSGTVLMPWPMNQNVPTSQFSYWTWRDTSKLALGGATGPGAGVGADPQRLQQITGIGLTGFYPQGEIPTIALPLMTEFRCYPDNAALGLNSFKTSFALNSSYRPTFRAYSTGGISGGNPVVVDPDNSPVAQGGINPVTGGPTLPSDNTVYHGQVDFVVRVSRGHTRWFDSGAASDFGDAVIEIGRSGLEVGTDLVVEFRGASSASSPSDESWRDAQFVDPYGEPYTAQQVSLLQLPKPAFSVTYFPDPQDRSWKSSLQDLDGARFVQARFTAVGNAETKAVAALAGLGIPFQP